MIGEFEQLVLMAVMHAGDDAYGVTVHGELRRRTRRDPSLAAVYKTLDRLEAKGLLSSRVGDPTPERGGRRKQFYALTSAGRKAVRDSIATIRRMARGLDVGLEPS
ncbi:MAG TPA: helix-turn-helix transcriptional regulator [Gemmatimonadaceae bacterium]|nr:helix-turn-helix transcriptional regulator [Gemmatimonadaceae bacterium]